MKIKTPRERRSSNRKAVGESKGAAAKRGRQGRGKGPRA